MEKEQREGLGKKTGSGIKAEIQKRNNRNLQKTEEERGKEREGEEMKYGTREI